MMKCLYFLLFVAVSQAFVIKETSDIQRSIPRPTFTELHLVDIPVLLFTIEWTPVTNTNADPVIGYRLNVQEEIRPNSNVYADYKDIFAYGGQNTLAAIGEIKTGVWYDLRVQAATWSGYGPLSLRYGILVHPPRDGARTPTYTFVQREDESQN